MKRRTLIGAAGAATVSAMSGKVAAKSQSNGPPIASTLYGKVRGETVDDIHIFKGIPYGASTAGANRFAPPKPPTPWAGVRDAQTFAPMAPQQLRINPTLLASWTFQKEISEDCLAINIWTPAVRDGVKRPVMVWLHGGGYYGLSGARNVFDGKRLCKKGDVVVVTLNHRLNAFGFLYLADIAPALADGANAGMQDLVAALRWVRDNIAAFGGDPDNVTIFGQSGGGGKVSTLMAMPSAAGLFHRAIVQSGSYARKAHLEAVKPAEATENARAYLAALGIEPALAGQKLRELPMEALVAGLKTVNRTTWMPVADGRVLPSGPWWPEGPSISANIPLMIGSTETELTAFADTSDPTAFALDEAALRKRLSPFLSPADIEPVIKTFRASRPNATPTDLFFEIMTAIPFRLGVWRQADANAAPNAAPVYVYELDWRTPVDGGKWGSPHSLDTPMVFDNVAMSASMVGNGPEPQQVADQMSSAWLAFARTGNPNTAGVPIWPAYTTKDRTIMVFNVTSKAVKGFRDDERKALSDLKAKGFFD